MVRCVDVTPSVLVIGALFGTALAINGGSSSGDVGFLREASGTRATSKKPQTGKEDSRKPVSSVNRIRGKGNDSLLRIISYVEIEPGEKSSKVWVVSEKLAELAMIHLV